MNATNGITTCGNLVVMYFLTLAAFSFSAVIKRDPRTDDNMTGTWHIPHQHNILTNKQNLPSHPTDCRSCYSYLRHTHRCVVFVFVDARPNASSCAVVCFLLLPTSGMRGYFGSEHFQYLLCILQFVKYLLDESYDITAVYLGTRYYLLQVTGQNVTTFSILILLAKGRLWPTFCLYNRHNFRNGLLSCVSLCVVFVFFDLFVLALLRLPHLSITQDFFF